MRCIRLFLSVSCRWVVTLLVVEVGRWGQLLRKFNLLVSLYVDPSTYSRVET